MQWQHQQQQPECVASSSWGALQSTQPSHGGYQSARPAGVAPSVTGAYPRGAAPQTMFTGDGTAAMLKQIAYNPYSRQPGSVYNQH
jgi:hypothetical protein